MLAGLKFSKEKKANKDKKKKDKKRKKVARNLSSEESECSAAELSPRAMRIERRLTPIQVERTVERTVDRNDVLSREDTMADIFKSSSVLQGTNEPQVSAMELNPQFIGTKLNETASGSDIPAHLMAKGCQSSLWNQRKRRREIQRAAGKLDISTPLPFKNDPRKAKMDETMPTKQLERVCGMYARNNKIIAQHDARSSATEVPLAKLNLEELVALENEEADGVVRSPTNAAEHAVDMHGRDNDSKGWRERHRTRNDGRDRDRNEWRRGEARQDAQANDDKEDMLQKFYQKHVKKDVKQKLAAGYDKREDNTEGLDANELAARAMEAMLAGDLETHNALTEKINQVPIRSSSSKNPEPKVDSSIPSELMAKMGKRLHKVEKCVYCMDSQKFNKKRDIVSECPSAYLCFARQNDAMAKWQLLIVPKSHSQAMVDVEENCADDIILYKRSIAQVYRNHGLAPVFIETVSRVDDDWKHKIGCGDRHTSIEVIPIPLQSVSDAIIYTKKSLQEAEEWTSNKGAIDCPRGIQGKIPSGFTYLHLDIALERGFAHVIEDPRLFPKDFGRSILHDMLEADRFTRAYASQEERDVDMAKFVENFKPLDWATGSMET